MLQNVISYPAWLDQTSVAIFWSGNESPMLNAPFILPQFRNWIRAIESVMMY